MTPYLTRFWQSFTRQLSLTNGRHIFLYLWLLPASQRKPIPWLDTHAQYLYELSLNELAIDDRASLSHCLSRVFVRPQNQQVAPPVGLFPQGLRRFLRRICRALSVVLGPTLSYLSKQFKTVIGNIDLRVFGQRVDVLALAVPTLTLGWRFLIAFICVPIVAICVTTPLTWGGQALFALLMALTALFVGSVSGRTARMFLMTLSVVATMRYLWWRLTSTINPDAWGDLIFGCLLLFAEVYAVLILLLGYFQTAWPLQRKPTSLPSNRDLWPSVDIFIPTYNEPLKILKPTVLAALGVNWPKDKIKIYILDDGRREEMRHFAAEAEVEYLVRPNNLHAKAGNLNHALQHSSGEFITIFDCDHIPTRSFLELTMGWFLRDPNCAMLQTPHHFFSPDPFKRNLNMGENVPAEDSLFHGLIQDGNDFWNATFFCGSCAVIRRKPLLEVGGIAVETVTEDAHTALKLHRLGYNTAFINIPQAAGLSTESIAGHVGQRIRWARGMVQIFRIDNPLFGKGLSLAQRLCYSNAMLHFMFGIPRLIFLVAPMGFMFFGFHLISAASLTIISYVVPQLFHASIANSRAQGKYRHSFWAEIYETVLAWHIAVPTTLALINPKLGTFNVTSKGDIVEKHFHDWTIATPYMLLMTINLLGICFGVVRLFWWNADETGTVLLNIFWVFYNLVILGVAMGTVKEARQIRSTHRIVINKPVIIYLIDGRTISAQASDYSMGGLGIVLSPGTEISKGEHLRIAILSDGEEYALNAVVAWAGAGRLGLKFESLSIEDEKRLVGATFARADAWTSEQRQQRDKPMQSLSSIIKLCFMAYRDLFLVIAGYLPDVKQLSLRINEKRKLLTR